jgi:hypothetical protein
VTILCEEEIMMWQKISILRYPQRDLTPGFTQVHRGQVPENKKDERDILKDKDETGTADVPSTLRNFENTDTELDTLEDLPGDFMRGEIDVKKQMDLAASAMDSSLRGLQNQAEENSPRGELGATFRDTPGGIEEVSAKTDEYLASHGLLKGNAKNIQNKKKLRRTTKGF